MATAAGEARNVTPKAVAIGATEAIATLREVVLMPLDLRATLPEINDGNDVVVFVHGFFASPGVFRPLRERMEKELGVKVASFTHLPGVRVDPIAKRLKALVDQIPHHARVHIVGHSLGGLVGRYYVQELGGHTRIAQTISLGSPFGGTKVANAMPVLVGIDLKTDSKLLHKLRLKAGRYDVPHLSVVADTDRMVIPQNSAMLPWGDTAFFRGLGHNGLLYDKEVMDLVVNRIRNAQTRKP